MQLSDHNLHIRNWHKQDQTQLVAAANNPKLAATLRDRFPQPYTLDHAIQFLEFCGQQHDPTHFAILNDTSVIGGIGLELGTDVERFNAELGYWLAEPFWGQGLMTRVIALFVPWAAQHFQLHRIFALPMAHNLGSIRCLEKNGFVQEGRLRESCFKNGHWYDQFLYSRLFN